MTRTCPQNCGRLATSAVFISIGIVQLIASYILLRSNYVYLLAGPNIWTAIPNIASGGLLGLSAAVWERISKPKHAQRRNVLAALVSSLLLLNTVTAIILILGEGNSLLSIQLEKSKTGSSATFASEILAYAFAASVCSPIICVVVATAFLVEMLFPKMRKSFRFKRVLETGDNTFSWVYKTEQPLPTPDPEIFRKALTSESAWSTSSDDDSCFSPEVDEESSTVRGIGKLDSGPNQIGSLDVDMEGKSLGKFSDSSVPRNSKSRVSFADEWNVLPDDTEMDDLQCRMKHQLKQRGDLFALSYDRRMPEGCLNASISSEKTQHVDDDDVLYSDRRMPEDPNASISSKKTQHVDDVQHSDRRIPEDPNESIYRKKTQHVDDDVQYSDRRMPEGCLNASITSKKRQHVDDDVQYSVPDVFNNFRKNLKHSGHDSLRKTSTTTSLKDSSHDASLPTSHYGHSVLQTTLSGASSNMAEDDLDRFNVSRGDDFVGEVVPIRMDTLPRKKLPSKLVPVVAPVMSSVRCHSLHRVKASKFKDVASGGTSSFKDGRGAKHRSKSTGSYPEKYDDIREYRKATSFDASAHDSTLQTSPAHTSGYMSSGDDTPEQPSLPTTDSFFPSPYSPGCSSSKRRKFAKRNSHELSSTARAEAIDDILKKIIIEKNILSDDTIEDLYNMINYRRTLLTP